MVMLEQIPVWGNFFLNILNQIKSITQKITSNKRNKYDFRYKKFIKKHAIYPEGHGIVINTLEIEAFNKVSRIKRFFDVSDGCKDIKLPSLNEMIKKEEKKRFVENGFWYKSRRSVSIELEGDGDEDKIKRFYFVFNPPIGANEIVEISYAFSINCMYPIDQDGKLDPQKAHSNHEPKIEFYVRHPIEHFELELAFRGIEVGEEPILNIYRGDSDRLIDTLEPDYYFDPFYSRYRFLLKNPNVGDKIKVKWKWKTKEA